MLDTRPSPIAGTWYKGSADALAVCVDEYLAGVKLPEIQGQISGIIVPHAGHIYSGAVAAHAFAALQGSPPDVVIILSPYHNLASAPLITSSHQAYATPLGAIEIDRQMLDEIQDALAIPIFAMANDREHAVEIELPFLQRIYRHSFKLVPLMLRSGDERVAQQLGEALGKVIKTRNAILVASTDLSHFYHERDAHKLDQEMLRRFQSFDPASIFSAEKQGTGFACGHAAVAAVLWALKENGSNKVQILKYATSGDITQDPTAVVGYGAAVITKTRLSDDLVES